MLALIGFNSVSAAVLGELEAAGRLPRLAHLRRKSTEVTLATPARSFPAGVFPTLWSGIPLRDHGIHYPFMWDAAGQRVRYLDSFPSPTMLWDRISEAGGRVLVVDPYEGGPSSAAGLTVSGWQFANRVVLRPSSCPSGAYREWQRRLTPAPRAEEVFGQPSEHTLRQLARTLVAGPRRVADLVTAALPEVSPDLLVADLPSVHLAGHQLWDPASVVPGIAPKSASELRNALDEIVIEADKALGRIIDALPAGADVIVFSPLGMDADTSRGDVLEPMLAAVLDNATLTGASIGGSWRLRAAVPTSLRARVASALPDSVAVALASRLELRGTDWSQTRAFAVPSDTSGLIRFNVNGRERDGIVAPGDTAALVAEIESGLSSFAFEDGSPVVAAIDVVADSFGGGEGSGLLPDLVVHWSSVPTRRGEVLHSPAFGTIRRDGAGSGRSGNHTADAWALVAATSGRAQRSTGDVVDIAATALSRFGLTSAGATLIEPT